nr:MAG TPA: hypothetical protein [Caudoviricetes sp.]
MKEEKIIIKVLLPVLVCIYSINYFYLFVKCFVKNYLQSFTLLMMFKTCLYRQLLYLHSMQLFTVEIQGVLMIFSISSSACLYLSISSNSWVVFSI